MQKLWHVRMFVTWYTKRRVKTDMREIKIRLLMMCERKGVIDDARALMELHWLPVDKRIEYKLLLYTYKALHGLAPGYLCKLVVPYEPRRVLRSAESNLLTVPPGKPGKYGSRSFVRASANLWNSLRGERAAWLKNSPTVESFKVNLKTYLFCERFLS